MRRVTTPSSARSAMKDWMVPPPYIMNAELRRPSTEDRLFSDWPGIVGDSGRLTPDGEVLLFKQLHFCGFKLSTLYKQASKRPTKGLRQKFNVWVQRYNLIRTRIIEANLGLVYDMIGRTRFEVLDRDEMTSEGMMALLRAADTFDPWRGYRFSTYACNAIIRAFSRAALMDSKRRSRIAGPFDVEFEKSDAIESMRTDQEALFTERLGQILQLDNAELTDVEKSVLARRFPFADDKPRLTLEDIGRRMHVSKERVRQIQLSAIAKLRRAIRDDPVLI
ncbi:MAG: sigma-70 family RNA polymerase sigma factor [Phycisphaerae bacterium]|nr:sigma-70 family RNA polymerase sigma factor [Phycisphaerae bacterium]